ncbi:MAG TPA: heme-binding protein [Rhizomicrobium sp.]|nr:heme-binding protein [Rhizomicrobium sp.]
MAWSYRDKLSKTPLDNLNEGSLDFKPYKPDRRYRGAALQAGNIGCVRRGGAEDPAAAQLATLPNMIALPGAVAIMDHGEIVGGLGVAGSPGGDKDEACAQAGVAKIKNQLPQ